MFTHTWDMVAYITKCGNKSGKQCSYVGYTMGISVVDKKKSWDLAISPRCKGSRKQMSAKKAVHN